jgi:DNA repair ATPase RecN
MFYFRYHDTNQIDALRKRYKTHQDWYELMQHEVQELRAQNEILKKRTASLLQQNEDYSKLVSELSRYYFHIKEATHKVQELGKLLRVYDSDLDQKLTKVGLEQPTEHIVTQLPVHKHRGWSPSPVTSESQKKYF